MPHLPRATSGLEVVSSRSDQNAVATYAVLGSGLYSLQRYARATIDHFEVTDRVVGMDAGDSFPVLRRDDFQAPFRIVFPGEFSDLVEADAVAVGRRAALTRPDQTILTSQDTAGSTISSDVRGNRVCRMKMPIPSERCRVKK